MNILRTRRGRKIPVVAGLLAAAIVLTIFSSLPKAAQTESIEQGRNRVKAQKRELLEAINGVGHACTAVSRVFLRGVDRAVPSVYWGAGCSNGSSYQVRVTSDRVRITDCTRLTAGAAECFSPLTEAAILLDVKNSNFREAMRPE